MRVIKLSPLLAKPLQWLLRWPVAAVSTSLQVVPADYYQFLDWKESSKKPEAATYLSRETLKEERRRQTVDHTLATHLSNKDAVVDFEFSNIEPFNHPELLKNATAQIRGIVFRSRGRPVVSGKKFYDLVVQQDGTGVITNSYVGRINVQNGARSLALHDTWVGHLEFEGNLSDLTVSGGGILHITCGSDAGPKGDTKISTFYPRFEDPRPDTLQSLRNLRKNMNDLHNNTAAGFFHTIELSLSRRSETKINKIISWLYEVLSDFGNSTTRPVAWFSLAVVSMFVIAFFDNNLVVTTEVNLASWQEVLVRSDGTGQLARAALYPFTSVLNPLGIFSSKALVQAGQTFWTFIYFPLTLLALTSLALFFISLRRRFRLE